ncbi:hypothetical protein [Roseimaritima sediminicola]|uniref:hypothetical protein n=1 Tax=Roseimaritima sediminicola TaxID=2662066 RepID=UPI001386DFFA|nr:hypothetical protein [Roseimaritima sediminicola]
MATCFLLAIATPVAWAGNAIRFDLPSLAVAENVSDSRDDAGSEQNSGANARPLPGQRLVRIPLRLSALVDAPEPPRIDQVMIQVYAMDSTISVVDYAPRTELASPYEGNLEIAKTAERNKHLGFTVDGGYGKMIEGTLAGDVAKKDLETVKFRRVAPLEVVAASGTLGRGRGVYFKLRSTALQVLEGDKQFEVVLSVPQDWQSGLLDVRIEANTNKKTFAGLDSENRCVGRAHFVVATFVDAAPAVRQAAMQLIERETDLRSVAARHRAETRSGASNLLRQMASALDLGNEPLREDWLYQVMRGTVDPHLDRNIRRLPMQVRIAILDYQDARKAFLEASTIAADPAVDQQALASQ